MTGIFAVVLLDAFVMAAVIAVLLVGAVFVMMVSRLSSWTTAASCVTDVITTFVL